MYNFDLAMLTNQSETARIRQVYAPGSFASDAFFKALGQKGLDVSSHSDILFSNPETTLFFTALNINTTNAADTLSSHIALDLMSKATNATVRTITGGAFFFAPPPLPPYPPPSPSPSPPSPPPYVDDTFSVHEGIIYFLTFFIGTLMFGACVVQYFGIFKQKRPAYHLYSEKPRKELRIFI